MASSQMETSKKPSRGAIYFFPFDNMILRYRHQYPGTKIKEAGKRENRIFRSGVKSSYLYPVSFYKIIQDRLAQEKTYVNHTPNLYLYKDGKYQGRADILSNTGLSLPGGDDDKGIIIYILSGLPEADDYRKFPIYSAR